MNEELEVTEPEVTEPAQTELIVEQSDIDKVFSFPVFEQIENVETNTTDILTELQKLNEFLIPTEEELEEMEIQQQAEIQALELEEPTETEPEPEVEVIDYQPLIYEELQTLNAAMLEVTENQDEGLQVSAESAFLLSITLVVGFGVKVLVDQITKW